MSAPADGDPRPLWYVSMHGHPEVYVTYLGFYNGTHRVEYSGWAENLLSAGVILPQWTEPSGKRLRDTDGDRVTITRAWREGDDGKPRRWFRALFSKHCVDDLPVVEDARIAMERYEAWSSPENRERRAEPAQARPALRLVVDNTRATPNEAVVIARLARGGARGPPILFRSWLS
jgi:hypothetical protein